MVKKSKDKKRTAPIKRNTTEVKITGKLNVDGAGKTDIKTGIGFLDHMLQLFAFHGLFDLILKVTGDLEVDRHHTNEDIGIALGIAFKKALGDCRGIKRYASFEVPMDEARAKVVVDIGNRYAFKKPTVNLPEVSAEGYSVAEGIDFLESFAKNLTMNLHIELGASGDMHHSLEAIFKAFGKALDEATQIDPRRKEIPSTKGII